MITYEVNGWTKFVERDDWEQGCDPSTATSISGEDTFRAGTAKNIVQYLMEWVGVEDKDAVLLDSCDEPGRVDIQVHETHGGGVASKHSIEEWKAGRKTLYLACYTFYVEEISRKPAVLEGVLA